MQENRKGFTLIELLVTVLVVGILASIAMPSFYRFLERSRTSEAVNVMGAALNAQNRYYIKRDQYATQWHVLDAVPDNIRTLGLDNGFSNSDNTVYYTKGGGAAMPNNGYAVSFDIARDKQFIVAERVGSNKYTYTIVRPFGETKFYCLPDASNEEDVRLCLDFAGVDRVDLLLPDPRTSSSFANSWH